MPRPEIQLKLPELGESFNSLFEMRQAQSQDRGAVLRQRLSILYLRCESVAYRRAIAYAILDFQFSI